MVLSDVDLLAALESGKIQITPAPDLETQLGACSLDLRLGHEFRVFERARTAFIDPRNGINWDEFTRVVEVPDGEAAADEGSGREEFFLEHLHVFSPASVALLAHHAGLRILTIHRLRDPSTKFTLFAFLTLP